MFTTSSLLSTFTYFSSQQDPTNNTNIRPSGKGVRLAPKCVTKAKLHDAAAAANKRAYRKTARSFRRRLTRRWNF
jgi:hypothetical protein